MDRGSLDVRIDAQADAIRQRVDIGGIRMASSPRRGRASRASARFVPHRNALPVRSRRRQPTLCSGHKLRAGIFVGRRRGVIGWWLCALLHDAAGEGL
jgi:hypothetical protein